MEGTPLPYNPAGLFSLVASYLAQPGTAIRTEQHNPVFEDVAGALSAVLLRDGRAPMTGALNMNNFPINNVAAGDTPGSVATLAQTTPIGGTIIWWLSSLPADGGWAWCNGAAISRASNPKLFALFGTTFGTGDGSTTFNLPDMREVVPMGVRGMGNTGPRNLTSLGSTIADVFGEQNHQLSQAEMPSHFHVATVSDPGHTHGTNAAFINGTPIAGAANFPVPGLVGGATIASAVSNVRVVTNNGADLTASTGGNGPHNNLQPTTACSYIIRVS